MAGVFCSPFTPQSLPNRRFSAKIGRWGQCIKIKNMHDFVLFIHKIVHKLAGVAGFEPKNDGVRGTLKTQKMAENSRKTL